MSPPASTGGTDLTAILHPERSERNGVPFVFGQA